MNSSADCFFNTSITKLIAGDNHEAIEYVELTNHETGEFLIYLLMKLLLIMDMNVTLHY